jgi:hypothetical protein
MYQYALFGHHLRSELLFPELVPVVGGGPHWTFKFANHSDPSQEVVLHEEELSATCRMRVSRVGARYRYAHSCTGSFEVSPDGRDVTFSAAADCSHDAVRLDLLARVLPLALMRGGLVCLHGSAVAWRDRAIALLGPKGSGKSTLALAATRAGAQHLSDDVLPIELDPVPLALPGDHTMRLNEDSTHHLSLSASDACRRTLDGKQLFTRPRAEALGVRPTRLAAIYLVSPMHAPVQSPTPAVQRRRLADVRAVPALLPHNKIGALLRGEAAGAMLGGMAQLAMRVPIYELSVARDWSRLDEAVAQLRSWHKPGEPD